MTKQIKIEGFLSYLSTEFKKLGILIRLLYDWPIWQPPKTHRISLLPTIFGGSGFKFSEPWKEQAKERERAI